MNRREQLVLLLEEYALRAGSRGGGLGQHLHGDAILLGDHDQDCLLLVGDCRRTGRLRCTCWRRSLPELERALTELQRLAPVHHGHLIERYVRSVTVRRQVWFRYGHWQVAPNERVTYPDLERGKTPPTKAYDALVQRWRPWVDLLIVAQALDRLELLYQGDVWLPREAAA